MAARAIWKAAISFKGASVPVKLYSAVKDRKIHFRMLHESDHVPVEQKMVHPETGEPVDKEDIRRGYEIAPGEMVILDGEDLERLEPQASRRIEMLRFFAAGGLGHQWYERPYFLEPDKGGVSAYAALCSALNRQNLEGFARWTMRKKQYIGTLQAHKDYLMLFTLRHREEVINASELPRPQGRTLESQELKMAEQLMEALEGEFDPESYRDEFSYRLRELVDAKARGKAIPLARLPARKKQKAETFSDLLEKSLEQVKRERKSA